MISWGSGGNGGTVTKKPSIQTREGGKKLSSAEMKKNLSHHEKYTERGRQSISVGLGRGHNA